MDIEKSLEKIEALREQRVKKMEEFEQTIEGLIAEVEAKMISKMTKINNELDNYFKWSGDIPLRKIEKTMAFCDSNDQKIEAELQKIRKYLSAGKETAAQGTLSNVPEASLEHDTKLIQAFSYTVFDTILFSITQGSAPDFTLISQSALFETVYANISRGYKSYLFNEVPHSAKAVILQGRNILEELREIEDKFLDEPELWDVYAPQIQSWWINSALPLIFGERDPEWDDAVLPTYDEMQRWKGSEYSQRQFFPAITDLIELAKENALTIADTFNFKQLLLV